jgi:hypothetical protein
LATKQDLKSNRRNHYFLWLNWCSTPFLCTYFNMILNFV